MNFSTSTTQADVASTVALAGGSVAFMGGAVAAAFTVPVVGWGITALGLFWKGLQDD